MGLLCFAHSVISDLLCCTEKKLNNIWELGRGQKWKDFKLHMYWRTKPWRLFSQAIDSLNYTCALLIVFLLHFICLVMPFEWKHLERETIAFVAFFLCSLITIGKQTGGKFYRTFFSPLESFQYEIPNFVLFIYLFIPDGLFNVPFIWPGEFYSL